MISTIRSFRASLLHRKLILPRHASWGSQRASNLGCRSVLSCPSSKPLGFHQHRNLAGTRERLVFFCIFLPAKSSALRRRFLRLRVIVSFARIGIPQVDGCIWKGIETRRQGLHLDKNGNGKMEDLGKWQQVLPSCIYIRDPQIGLAGESSRRGHVGVHIQSVQQEKEEDHIRSLAIIFSFPSVMVWTKRYR